MPALPSPSPSPWSLPEPALTALIAETGLAIGPDALADLLAGIAAAPPCREASAWLSLIAPDLPAPAAARLCDLVAELRGRMTASQMPPADRLPALREELARRGLDGFVVPRADQHQGEYVPARDERLAWLTGFSGSAGLAIVLRDRAALFVDGRYTVQARQQVDPQAFLCRHLADSPPEEWLVEMLPAAAVLGYDPRLLTAAAVARLQQAVAKVGASLQAVEDNPLDAVWPDQPPPPLAPVVPHPVAQAGRTAADKREEIAQAVRRAGAEAAVLSAPDALAWLLNIRGGDVPHTPLALGHGILDGAGRITLFLDPRKLSPGLADHLGAEVAVRPAEALAEALTALGRRRATVLLDQHTAGVWLAQRLEAAGATVRLQADPCALPKARKTVAELEGARAAHRRDGVAVCRFLAWLAREAPGGGLDEIAAADRLAAVRAEGPLFRDLSFETISGAGPNGAIVHYRVTPASNRPLLPGSLYLVDSGAQYLDGTTDITRTVAIGAPGPEERERFTLVLKGHIALATARFPHGTLGSQLDALARQFLWQEGLDFDHGTGHGVGSYLGVHEGPQRISKHPGAAPLEPGMICSNEPGYYREGAYGIRIENLVAVRDSQALRTPERPMLEFETLTLAPIDLSLVEPLLMTSAEIAWLDGYHARVRDEIGPLLDAADRAWLEEATQPLEARAAIG